MPTLQASIVYLPDLTNESDEPRLFQMTLELAKKAKELGFSIKELEIENGEDEEEEDEQESENEL